MQLLTSGERQPQDHPKDHCSRRSFPSEEHRGAFSSLAIPRGRKRIPYLSCEDLHQFHCICGGLCDLSPSQRECSANTIRQIADFVY